MDRASESPHSCPTLPRPRPHHATLGSGSWELMALSGIGSFSDCGSRLFLILPARTITTTVASTSIICGVAYGEDVDAARDVILEAVRNVDSVRNDGVERRSA